MYYLYFANARQHDVLHFTQLIWATANKIGCAASTYVTTSNGQDVNNVLLACNYNAGNVLNTPVYVAGTAASKCSNGKNSNFQGLCA